MFAPTSKQGANAPLPPEQWLKVLDAEYLHSFVPSGGSAVRFISGDDDALDRARNGLVHAASESRYHFVPLDPSKLDQHDKKPDLHRIEKFFFAVARTIDWERMSREQLLAALDSRGIRFPDGKPLDDYEAIADFNGLEPADLRNKYERLITDLRLRDLGMAVELRIALTALGRAQLIPTEMTPTTEELLLDWLRGEKPVPGANPTLKKIGIYERVGRSNARSMFESLVHWLRTVGLGGLMVVFDFRPYEQAQIPQSQRLKMESAAIAEAIADGADNEALKAIQEAHERTANGVRYSKQAYIQSLEMLRHFIDEIERLEGFVLVVLGSRNFFDDRPKLIEGERRFFDYNALQTRIGLEIHDAERQNPSAPLVHLGGA